MKKLVKKPVWVLSAGAAVLALLLAGCNGHEEVVGGNGSNGAALPPDVQFTITPKRVPVNGVAILDWKVVNATADTTCQASGAWGSNNPDAPASRPVESSHGPYTDANPAPEQVKTSKPAAGNYDYILSCTGPGGTTHVVQRLVVGGPAITMSLTPAAIALGETATVRYAVEGAVRCIRAGTDGHGWNTASGANDLTLPSGEIVLGKTEDGAYDLAGLYTYTMVCTDSATPTAANTSVVSKVLTVGNVSDLPKLSLRAVDAQIAPGGSALLGWTMTPASSGVSCTPGGATVEGWSGSQPSSRTGELLKVGPFNNAGEYTLTLTCSGTFSNGSTGVVSSVVTISVFNTHCDDDGDTSRITLLNQMVIPTASLRTRSADECLLPVCGVSDPNGALDNEPNPDEDATVTNLSLPISLGLLGDTVSYTVSATPDLVKINPIDGSADLSQCGFQNDNLFGRPVPTASCPTPVGPYKVGFVISNPDALLTLALLKKITVVTSLVHSDGRPTEGGDSDPDSRFDIDLLTILTGGGLLPIDENREKLYLAEVVVSKPANTVALELSNDVAGLLSEVNVHNVCVSLNAD